MVQLSHLYMTTGKTIALIEGTDWKGSLHKVRVYKSCAGNLESEAMCVVTCDPQSQGVEWASCLCSKSKGK